jgi:hypothetical protein
MDVDWTALEVAFPEPLFKNDLAVLDQGDGNAGHIEGVTRPLDVGGQLAANHTMGPHTARLHIRAPG